MWALEFFPLVVFFELDSQLHISAAEFFYKRRYDQRNMSYTSSENDNICDNTYFMKTIDLISEEIALCVNNKGKAFFKVKAERKFSSVNVCT